MTQAIDDLKIQKHTRSQQLRNRMEDAMEQLSRIQSQRKTIYVGSGSEDVWNEAVAAQQRIRVRE